MGLFDFIRRAQEKLLALQEKINTTPVEDLFKRKEKKPKRKKRKRRKPVRRVLSPAEQIKAQRDSFIRNGFDEYEFIANHDCCSVCGELNGKHFPVSELQIGVNAPPMHEGCRCSIAAYSDRKEYEEWLDFVSKGGTTKQFNKKKRKG